MVLGVVGIVRLIEHRLQAIQRQEICEKRESEDDLSGCLSEMLKNMKFLKLYGWVQWYRQRIEKCKTDSIASEKRSLRRYIILSTFSSIANQLIPIVTFSVFVGLGNTLDLAMVIVA